MSDSTIESQDVASASPTEDLSATVSVERDIAWRRILAYLIDFKLILAGPFFLLMEMELQATTAIKIAPYAHWIGLAWMVAYLLFVIMLDGQSVGMRLCGIKLVKRDGTEPGTLQIIVRWSLLFLIVIAWLRTGRLISSDWESITMLGMLNFFLLGGQKGRGQLIHGFFSGTHVIFEDGQPNYPLERISVLPILLLIVLFLSPIMILRGNDFGTESMVMTDRVEKKLKQDKRVSDVWAYGSTDTSLTLHLTCYLGDYGSDLDLHLDMVQDVLAEYEKNNPLALNGLSIIEVNINSEIDFLVYNYQDYEYSSDRIDSVLNWKFKLDERANAES